MKKILIIMLLILIAGVMDVKNTWMPILTNRRC